MAPLHPPPSRPKALPASLPDRETLAGEALGFLAEDAERLSRFMALTGLTAATIRTAASAAGFSEAVLSHLASDEALLVTFAAAHCYDPDAVGRIALPPDGDAAP